MIILIEPHIVMHSKTPISVVKETPAHIGWRNEQKTLTTLNSSTGNVEQHTLTNKVPIYGTVQQVIIFFRFENKANLENLIFSCLFKKLLINKNLIIQNYILNDKK